MKRAVVQVVGPPGAGATTLIERLLRSSRSRSIGVLRLGHGGGPETGADECERYLAAGALTAVGAGAAGAEVTSVWDVLEEHDELLACDVVVIEGGSVEPREVDIVVFVAPPLGAGEAVLLEERREVDRIDGGTALALLLGLHPDDVSDGPDEFDEEADVEVVETYELSEREAAAIRRLLDEGFPAMRDGAWLRAGWEALEGAELAVVNVRADGERAAARTTRDAIAGLRSNPRWQVGAVARRRDAGPRRCLVGDLSDARDDGTRRVIEAIKRRWR